jgi:hypothetical protein
MQLSKHIYWKHISIGLFVVYNYLLFSGQVTTTVLPYCTVEVDRREERSS